MSTLDEHGRASRVPRVPANDRVWIEGHAEMAWSINWSPTGLCVLAAGALEPEGRVTVELPDRYARCDATVVWARRHRDGVVAGLRFEGVERAVAAVGRSLA
jgi:hypothetical protein